jgi:5-methylcytosine-specific restriction enzyme B
MKGNQFTWVSTHKEIVEFLKTKEDKQNELIELLKKIGVDNAFFDQKPSGNMIPLEEIDPFTFFNFIYKYGTERRLKFLQSIARELNLTIPYDDKGIPSVNPQNLWMFPFSYRRTNEIKLLWDFFFSALDNTITDNQFEEILNIENVGLAKITSALFCINPDKYFPINGPTKPYLLENFNINPDIHSYKEYKEILKKIQDITGESFYSISYKAWVYGNEENIAEENKLGTDRDINYWIFQGNPDIFDVVNAIKNNHLTSWNIRVHKDKIKKGDIVIIWLSKRDQGVYALAEILSDVYIGVESEEQLAYEVRDNSNPEVEMVEIKITHNLGSNPITKNEIDSIPELVNLKVGRQGTNFHATYEEYKIIEDLSQKRERYWVYAPDVNAKQWDEFYNLGIMGLGWSYLGDLRNYTSKDEIRRKIREVEGETTKKNNSANINYEFCNTIKQGDFIFVKQGTTKLLGYGKVTSDYYYDSNRNNFQSCRKVQWLAKGEWEPDNKLPIKTLTDITYSKSSLSNFKYIHEYYLDLIKNISHDQSTNKVRLPLNQILYGPPGTGKTYKSILIAAQIIDSEIEDEEEAIVLFNTKLGSQIQFITFHQSYSYEEFIQGIRPDINKETSSVKFTLSDGVFLELCERARQDKENPYILIIDEINRGNISKIFGELITLIEPDKREGGEIPIKVLLPSKKYFSVPSNVYIIGTMNTADKSIALLDVALRRRFEFKALYPDYSLDELKDIDVLRKMNEMIIEKKGHDFQIGHSYFLKEPWDLSECMNLKVIPLLMEYFLNDRKEVEEILKHVNLSIVQNSYPLRVK